MVVNSSGQKEVLMEKIAAKVGMKVVFGARNGEKTEGVIAKVNTKSLKVIQTGTRGVYPRGTAWNVAPGLCTYESEGKSYQLSGKPLTPAQELAQELRNEARAHRAMATWEAEFERSGR
jgi:hypothetical protein